MSRPRPPRRKEPLEMLVSLLLRGGRIKYQGYTWAMGVDGSLCWVDSNEVGHRVDCDIKTLKSMADDIPRETIWLALCALTLKEGRSGRVTPTD